MLKTRNIGKRTWLFGALVGMLLYLTVIMVIILIGSVLIQNGSVPAETASVSLLLFMLIASYIGCLIAGLVADNNKLYSCVAVVAVSLLLRMVLTLFTYEAHISGTLINTIPEVIGCALALLTILKKGNKTSKTKKIKKRYL